MAQQTVAQKLIIGRALIATVLGVLGYLINCLPLPLFSNILLVVGNALILVCASRLGLGYTLWCAAIALTGLMQTFGTVYVYLIYGLEAVFVWALRRRGWFLIYSDFLYWCLLGMPLTWFVIQHAFYIPGEYQLFTVVKQSFNGLLYTVLASLFLLLIPKTWLAELQQQPRLFQNIHKKLVHAVLVLISLALMVSVLLANGYLMQVQKTLLTEHMHERNDHLVSQYHDYLAEHQNALEIVSGWLGNSEPIYWQQQLEQLHQIRSNFIGLQISHLQYPVLLEDQQWRMAEMKADPLLDSSQLATLIEKSLAEKKSHIDNQIAKVDGHAAVMISTPILASDGKIMAMLSAVLTLTQDKVDKDQSMWGELASVLTDANGQVIQASAELPLTMFTDFSYSQKRDRIHSSIPLMNLSRSDSFVGEYFYNATTLDNGWSLYVLLPYRSVAQRQEQYFLSGIALLLLGMIVVVFFTRRLSAYITAPLEFLVQRLAKDQLDGDPLSPLPALPFEPTKEIKALYQELTNNRNALKVYQLQLEDLVQTRTAELEAVNARLARLAHRDGLTGAYNRRYFDQQFEVNRQHCARSGGQLALAMIDIDHFKSINDNYGHLVGDDCLKSLVALIQQQFSRKLDLLARFGGEEFVLLLPQSDADEVLKRLETLRDKVEKTALSEDSQGNLLFVTISIGVLIAKPKYSETMNYWLMAADDALYHAKEQGRNRLCQAQVMVSAEPSWTVQEIGQPMASS